jgi:site-specific DNA-cytosine methylase
MGWPDGHTIVGNWNGKGNPSVMPHYHRAPDGLAGRAHDRGGVDGSEQASTLRGFGHGWQGQHMSTNAIYTKSRRAQTDTDDETWVEGEVMPTLNSFDVGDVRTTAAIVSRDGTPKTAGGMVTDLRAGNPHPSAVLTDGRPQDDPLLPLGLDSHRYRCCGNGVVAPVAEWIGLRLRDALA